MVKKLGTLINKESEFIHSPFNGEQILGREAISATIKLNEGKWHEVKLQSYSPFGIEFINDGLNIKQGASIALKIKLAGDETEFDGLIVNSVYEESNLKLAGVKTFIKDKTSPTDYSGQDRRAHRRWNCSEDFLPTGTAPNPVRYNDYILFRVDDISSSGLKLITSMRNKFIGIGQRLECTLSLPYAGTVKASVKVKHVNTTFYRDKEFLVMGVEFIKIDPLLLRNLGEYLLNFAKDVTVKSLNKEGFKTKHISKWLDFSYVKTEEEYMSVLNLRLQTYKNAGKVPTETKAEEMASETDAWSNILIAKSDNKIIGSIAYILPQRIEDIPMTGEVKYPEHFPDVKNTVYVWRLCVASDFRTADVTHELVSRTIYNAVINNRRYLRACVAKNLLNFYLLLGLKQTGIKYVAAGLNNIEHEILLMDIYDIISAKNISIKYWNILYSGILDYLLATSKIELSPLDKLRIWFYRAIGSIMNYI